MKITHFATILASASFVDATTLNHRTDEFTVYYTDDDILDPNLKGEERWVACINDISSLSLQLE